MLSVLAVAACAASDYGRGRALPEDMILGEGQVRAIEIGSEGQLIGGPKAEGRPGDYLIYNDRVGFVIAGVRPASGFSPFGGVVEDAGVIRVENGEQRWYNVMGDTYFSFYKGGDPLLGSRLFAPVKSKIAEDGSGGVAAVRFYGRDAEFQLRKEQFLIPSSPLNAKLMVDYILEPGSSVLEIRATVVNDRSTPVTVGVANMLLMGDGAPLFSRGAGFNKDLMDGKSFPWFAAPAGKVSYSWFIPGGEMEVHSRIGRLVVSKIGSISAPADDSASLSIFLAVGDGDVASALERMYESIDGSKYGVIAGKCVSASTGKPAPHVTVHVFTDRGEYENQAVSGADGSFRLALPAGSYILQAGLYEIDDSEKVAVDVASGLEKTLEIKTGDPAVLDIEVRDGTGKPIPATVSFKALNKIPSRFDSSVYFVNRNGGGFYKNYFAHGGRGEVAIKPGRYDVYVSHGFEYEYKKIELEAGPGERIVKRVSLDRVVDTGGYLCGDFHLHAAPSFDSDDKLDEKVAGLAAAGVEVPVSTDHDRNTDYTPSIARLGLVEIMKSIVGDELTTKRLGHFNAYPLAYDPFRRNEGAVDWYGMKGGEIFEAFRKDSPKDVVVQINHPRSPTLGYFALIGLDPETCKAAYADEFSLNFDTMEVLNGSNYDNMRRAALDWYCFLNRGKRVTGLGNSDSHRVFELQVGYPRNYVQSPAEEAGEMVEKEFIRSIKDQKVTVSAGPFITVEVNGGEGGMGDVVTDTDGTVELGIKVQAASWVEVSKLRIVNGGGEEKVIEVMGSGSPVVFNGKVEMNQSADTWYVVYAEGTKDMFPVYPGKRPFAFTNPVYIDADGNGKYDPPLEFEM